MKHRNPITPGILAGAISVLVLTTGVTRAEESDDLRELVETQGKQIQRLEQELEKVRGHQAGSLDYAVDQYLAATEEAQRDLPRGSLGGGFGQRVRLGGYFSVEYRDDGDASTSEFDQHRLVLKVQADIAEGISFESEIEIEGGGSDVDFLDGNEILVEYAELTFQVIEDKLDFIAGLILIPWGRFNFYHDDPINELTDRPLVSRRIAAVPFDQPGIAVAGTLEAGDGWFIDYRVALVQGFDDGFSTNGGVRDARQSFRSDNNNNKAVFGRFVLAIPIEFFDVLEAGASFVVGKHDPGGALSHDGVGLELFFKKGPFTFTGEYMMLDIDQPAGAPASDPRGMDGWYIEVAYRIFPARWRGRHVLFTDESAFTFVVRIDSIDLNDRTRGTSFRDDLQKVTIGFNFRPVQRTVFKISYSFVDSDDPSVMGSAADQVILSWATYF